jgi:hypothetical protein
LCLFKKKKTQKSKKCVNFLRKIKSNLANELKLTSRIKLFVNFKRIKLKMKKNCNSTKFRAQPILLSWAQTNSIWLISNHVFSHHSPSCSSSKGWEFTTSKRGKKIDSWGIWIPLFLTPPTIIGCQDLDIDIGLVMPYWFMFSMYFLVKLYNIFFLKRSEVI